MDPSWSTSTRSPAPMASRANASAAGPVIGDPGELLPVIWMAASVALPLLVFLVPRHPAVGPAVRA